MLEEILNKTQNINLDELFVDVFQESRVQEFVEDLNKDQLFAGVDSNNVDLEDIGGDYTNKTKAIKRFKGQPVDRVTLRDTGDFYDSIELELEAAAVDFVADFDKEGVDLRDRWGQNLLGLTEQSKEKLKEFVLPIFQQKIRQRIGLL